MPPDSVSAERWALNVWAFELAHTTHTFYDCHSLEIILWRSLLGACIQWLPKLPQCLVVFERCIYCVFQTLEKNINKSVDNIWHHGFPMQFTSCDLNYNWVSNKWYKMVTHWGSFGSIHFSTTLLELWVLNIIHMVCGNK